MEITIISLVVLVLAGLTIWINLASYSKAKRLIYQWAERNGYSITDIQQRLFRRGPFLWTSSKAQLICYVSLDTPEGSRNAYIRCGSFWGGMLSDNMNIEWD